MFRKSELETSFNVPAKKSLQMNWESFLKGGPRNRRKSLSIELEVKSWKVSLTERSLYYPAGKDSFKRINIVTIL